MEIQSRSRIKRADDVLERQKAQGTMTHTMLATKRLNTGKGGSTFKGVSSSSSSSSQPRPRSLSRFSCRASSGNNEQTRGSSNGVETGSAGLYFVDKLVEDPVNALLVLGPRALAGALEAMPKTVEEVQQESQQVRDRLTMLAQDPRPWEVKSQMLVQVSRSDNAIASPSLCLSPLHLRNV